MTELIGIRHIALNPYCISYKREALIFQQIAVPGLVSQIEKLAIRDYPESAKVIASDLEWLLERNILFEPSFRNLGNKISKKLRSNEEYMSYRNKFRQEIKKPLRRRGKSGLNTDMDDAIAQLDERGKILDDYWSRLLSIELRESSKLDTYPILTSRMHSIRESQVSKTNILSIVLRALPLPDDSISWEQVLEYRSDPNSRSKFFALRNWMNEVAQAKLSPIEVEQKLEYLIDQYQQHMKLHKLKTNAGMFETIVISSAELLEDLVKFKWGKMAKGLFSFRQRRIALLEGELKSPGNEIAYIVQAREKLS